MSNPCKYISHLYDREELAEFTQHCFVKYQDAFQGPTRKFPWTVITHRDDQQKLKQILANLFDVFESIGQPLVASEPKIFYSDPLGYGIIHKDPIGYQGKHLDEYSKWACNIPAVESDQVHLEFFSESISSNTNFGVNQPANQRYGFPDFYQKYSPGDFTIGTAPEEQMDPVFVKPMTDTLLLDTTQWHRTRSFSDQTSIRIQYFTYWDLQKSYQDTVEDLGKHLLPH